jgi:hypothetical protein
MNCRSDLVQQFPKAPKKKHKADKVQKIILQDTKVCYVTGRTDGLALHHIFYGNGKRNLSDKYGLTVWLRHEWHTGNEGVHFKPTLDKDLKQLAQRAFEQVYGRELFVKEFGRNYL